MRARALTPDEKNRTFMALSNLRDQTIFILGCRTGFRISELLSLRWRDVLNDGDISEWLYVERRNVKGKDAGQRVPLHHEARNRLNTFWVSSRHRHTITPERFLFRAYQGLNRPLDRKTFWKALTEAFRKAKVYQAGGTHAMRKTFAAGVYERLGGDLRATQKAMRHKSLESTMHYLQEVDSETVNAAILGG